MAPPTNGHKFNGEWGEKLANVFRTEPKATMKYALAKVGIPQGTHTQRMQLGENAEPGTDASDYYRAVMIGLHDAYVADQNRIDVALEVAPGSHVSTYWNKEKHWHDVRFRMFNDVPTKLELTGKDGADLHKPLTREEALKELAELAATDPDIAALLARYGR